MPTRPLAGGTRRQLRRRALKYWYEERHQRRCCYCCSQLHFTHDHRRQATIEHIIPMSMGGKRTCLSNILLACRECNSTRGVKSFRSYVKGLPREQWLLQKYEGAKT